MDATVPGTAPRRLYVLVENADGSLGVLERTTSLPEMIRIEDMVHDPVTKDVFVNVTRASDRGRRNGPHDRRRKPVHAKPSRMAPMMDAFAYGENDTLTSELYVAAGDGSGTAVALTSGTWSGGLWQWLPDASGIAYTAGIGLHVAAADGSGSTTLSNTENGNVEGFVISPDGSLAVYKTPLGLYEATTDGVGDPVLVTDDPSTGPVQQIVQFSSHLEVPAYAYWKSSELDFRVVEELPYEFVVAAVEVFRMMVLRNISAILYETDMDGDGARELYLREIPAGGLTELPPPTLLNDGGQDVGEVHEIEGGVAFTHVPPPDAGLYEIWVQLFGAETAEMVFEMARIGLLQGLQ